MIGLGNPVLPRYVAATLMLLVLFSALGAGIHAEAQMPPPSGNEIRASCSPEDTSQALKALSEIQNTLHYIKSQVDKLSTKVLKLLGVVHLLEEARL